MERGVAKDYQIRKKGREENHNDNSLLGKKDTLPDILVRQQMFCAWELRRYRMNLRS